MPAAPVEVGEEGMRSLALLRVLSVQRFGQDANFIKVSSGVGGCIEAILGRQEHGSRGEHDGGIIEDPGVIKSGEIVDCLLEEGVALLCENEVIGDTNGNCLW